MSARHGRRPLMPAWGSSKWVRIGHHKIMRKRSLHKPSKVWHRLADGQRWFARTSVERSRWRPW